MRWCKLRNWSARLIKREGTTWNLNSAKYTKKLQNFGLKFHPLGSVLCRQYKTIRYYSTRSTKRLLRRSEGISDLSSIVSWWSKRQTLTILNVLREEHPHLECAWALTNVYHTKISVPSYFIPTLGNEIFDSVEWGSIKCHHMSQIILIS
jgi:hypothetical protein